MTTDKDAAYITDSSNKKYKFPFNINSLTWNYQLNTQSFSTIGGRVTQILSAQITSMILQGEAGSRKSLIELYDNFRTLQDDQNQTRKSVTLNVPSRNIVWQVYLEQMQIGWDVTTVTYPYYMSFEVEEDVNGNALSASTSDALNRIVNDKNGGIGYNGLYTGMSSISSINVKTS